ncbi:MAG: SDR family oxidoreductase [Planctomycetota bacterium]
MNTTETATDVIGQSLSGKRVLVTGGAGFIGSNLVKRLVGIGADVRVLDNFSTGFQANLATVVDQIELIHGDASVADDVSAAVADCDVIFHQAALASVPASMRDPSASHAHCATSTVNLLSAAAQSGCRRFVLASTSAAYGESPHVAKREDDPPMPLSPYAAAKLSSEMYCRTFATSFAIPTVCLRYFNVFGPHQDPDSEYSAVIPKFVSLILEGKRPIIFGDGMQSRDFVFVENVVDANLLAATQDDAAGGVFNIGCGRSITLLQLLETLSTLLDRPIEPIHQAARVGDVRDSLADISRARSVLHYEPRVDITEGLKRSIAYYQQVITSPS